MPAVINGQGWQHALIDLTSNAKQGIPFLHRLFSSISFSDEGAKEAYYDSLGAIAGYTIKPRKTDGKIKMKLQEWQDELTWLRTQAALLSVELGRPCGPGQVEITATLSCGATLSTSMTRRIRYMVQQDAFDSTDDQNVLEIEIPLFIMDVTDEFGQRFVERGESP